MIGQNLYPLDVLQRVDEGTQGMQIVIVVGYARDEYVSHPNRLADVGQIARAIEDVTIRASGQLAVLRVVDLLEVKKKQVSVLHQLCKL